MIKHWRLFDSITAEQIRQLRTAGIYVKIEDDVSYLDFPLQGRVPFVKSQDVYISTLNEKQETLLHIMFVDTLKFMGYTDAEIR
jgi:hypothetical protein